METVGKSNCQIRLPKVTSKDCGFFLSCQILFPARNWEIEPTNLAFIMIFTDRKTGIIDISVAGCIIPKPKNAMMIPLDFDVGWVTQPPSPRKLSRVPWLPRRRWTLGFQFSWFPGSETMACWILSNWFSDAPTGKPGGPLNTRCVCATPPAGNGQVPEHTDSFVWLCGPHQQRRSRTHSGGFRDGRHQRQLESDQRQVCQEGWLKGGAQNGQTISNLTPFNDFQWFIGFSMGSWWGHHFIFLFLYPFINRRLHLPPWWVLSSLHWEDHPSSTLADHQVTKYGSQSSGSTSAPRRTYYDPSAFPQSKPTQRLSLVDGKFTSLITDSKLDKGAFQLTVSLDSLAEAKGVAEIPDLTRSCFFFFRLWFVPWFFQAGVPTIWGIQRRCACFVMFLFSFSLLKQIYKDIWVEYSADGLPAVWFAMAPPCQTAHPQACHQRGLDLPIPQHSGKFYSAPAEMWEVAGWPSENPGAFEASWRFQKDWGHVFFPPPNFHSIPEISLEECVCDLGNLHEFAWDGSNLSTRMLYGGFAFYGDGICAILAVTTRESKHRIQFGKPITLKLTSIEASRFQEIVSPYFLKQGATKFCWLSPGEEVSGLENHCNDGAFAYLMEDESSLLAFPVV